MGQNGPVKWSPRKPYLFSIKVKLLWVRGGVKFMWITLGFVPLLAKLLVILTHLLY